MGGIDELMRELSERTADGRLLWRRFEHGGFTLKVGDWELFLTPDSLLANPPGEFAISLGPDAAALRSLFDLVKSCYADGELDKVVDWLRINKAAA